MSTHKLRDILGGILRLRKRKQPAENQTIASRMSKDLKPFYALDVLSTDFVIEHMRHLIS